MKEPIFNIIYIPGTVDYQSLALVSLLLNSNYSFRLVGNALCDKEASLLNAIADCSDRLSYINFKSDFIIPHGTLLDLLFQKEESKNFCFCDSDLFLFNPISASLESLIDGGHVFSSAGRIENDNQAVYAGFKGGATTISPDGKIPLATSFFCIYRYEELKKTMYKYHIGFEQYRQLIQIPKAVQDRLKPLKLDFDMFDTGKLLSVMYHIEGFKNIHADIEGLVHLGGMSGRYLQDINMQVAQEYDDSVLDMSDQKNTITKEKYKSRNAYEISLKRLYGKYFYTYLHYLIGKSKKPVLKITNPLIKSTIIQLMHNIESIIKESLKNPELTLIIKKIKEYKK
ncbi:MAG: hypothetical protein AB8B80_11295 [Marinicellaceae bacterium]